jgi:hypothetical protein
MGKWLSNLIVLLKLKYLTILMISVTIALRKLIVMVTRFHSTKRIFITNGVGCGRTTQNSATGNVLNNVPIEDANEKTVLYGARAL